MSLELIGGEFSYNSKKKIFTDLSFRLPGGEILSILGPNGCGKTTLLKCLIGILRFTRGRLIINGKEVAEGEKRSAWFGYVPQATTSPLSYTVFQMVLLGRSRFMGTFSRPSEKDIEKAEEAIARLDIRRLASRPFSSLSGGERQLVLIARALVTEARILLFDEPTSALDLINQHNTVELMRSLAHEFGLSIIFSTHAPSHALHISDQTLLLQREQGAVCGPAGAIITEETIHSHFGIEAKILEFTGDGDKSSIGVLPILKPFRRRRKVLQ